MDIKQLLADARLPERTVPLCLRGDLQADFEDAERRLTEAQRNQTDSLAGSGEAAIAAEIETLRAEMAEHTITFRFRALPRTRWSQVIAEHPPRPDRDGDRVLGVNEDSMVAAIARECLVEPTLDDGDWDTLVGKLTDWQYHQLGNTAWAVNRGSVDIPFSPAASRIHGRSAPGSKQPNG